MAANVTTMSGRTINITLSGDVDWAWDSATERASVPQLKELNALKRLFIDSILFEPAAIDDKVSIREKSLTGPIFFHRSGQDTYDQRIQYFDGKAFEGIYIAASDVISDEDGAYLIIILA